MANQLKTNKIVICEQSDIPVGMIGILQKREGVYECWAKVTPIRAQKIYDYRMSGLNNPASHELTIERPKSFFITIKNVIYMNGLSSNNWFRIVGIEDMLGLPLQTKLLVSLIETYDARSAEQKEHEVETVKEPAKWRR
jgi:hypothetical protein